MTPRHLVRRAADARYVDPGGWAKDARGFRVWPVVDEAAGAVHTGFDVCELDPGGSVPAHVHSFEESVYLLEGALTVQTPGAAAVLAGADGAGDYGLVPVGVPHVLRNTGTAVARWARMRAPQPRSRYGEDTTLVPSFDAPPPTPIDVRDPRNREYGHIAPGHMDPGRQSQSLLAVSASMRTALLVYSGITVKMMVDSDLGATLSTMFMVRYDPDGSAGPHDHPFEETYLILEGSTDATFDGEHYRLDPGDVAWAGAGCVHSFAAADNQPVRWLETQAPQPPGRHSYRFARDWDYLHERLDGAG